MKEKSRVLCFPSLSQINDDWREIQNGLHVCLVLFPFCNDNTKRDVIANITGERIGNLVAEQTDPLVIHDKRRRKSFTNPVKGLEKERRKKQNHQSSLVPRKGFFK